MLNWSHDWFYWSKSSVESYFTLKIFYRIGTWLKPKSLCRGLRKKLRPSGGTRAGLGLVGPGLTVAKLGEPFSKARAQARQEITWQTGLNWARNRLEGNFSEARARPGSSFKARAQLKLSSGSIKIGSFHLYYGRLGLISRLKFLPRSFNWSLATRSIVTFLLLLLV